MSQLDAIVRISAIDNASAVFARVAAHAKSIGQQFRSIVAAPQQQAAQLSAAAAHFERTAATTMFAPTAGALSVGVLGRDAYTWDRALSTFKAISEASPESLDGLLAKINEVSNALGVQRSELIQAAQAWINIGGKTDDLIPVIERVTKNSRLMGISVAEALKESRAVMIAFGLDPNIKENVYKVEDYFVIGAKNQPFGGAGFVEGMKQFAPVAGAVHLSMEAAAAMFETITQGGFQPGEAGRALKTFVMRLAAPSRDAINELAAAGIGPEKLFELGLGRITDVNSLERRFAGAGLALPPKAQELLRQGISSFAEDPEQSVLSFTAELTKAMTEALGVEKGDARNKGIIQKLIWNHFSRAMEGLSMEGLFALGDEPLAALTRIAGKEHAAKILELFRNKRRFDQNLLTHMTQQDGAVDRKFAIWAQGFAFQWDRVMATFNNLLGSISGRGVSGDISHVFGALASMFEGLQAMDPTMVRAGFWMTALAAAAPVAALAIGGLAASFKQLGGAAMLLIGGPWRAALTALAAFGTYAYSQNLGGFADALTELAGAAMTLGPMIRDAGEAFDAFYQSFKASAGIAGDANILTDTFTLLGNSIRTIAQAFREASAAYNIWKNRDNPDWVPSPAELDKLNRQSFEQHRDRAQLPTTWETIPLYRPPSLMLPTRPGEPLLPPSQSSGSLIMDLFKAGAGGLQLPPVSVTGQVSGQMQITVKVDGPGQVTEQSGGQISGPLNTGQGMGDVSSSGLPTYGP